MENLQNEVVIMKMPTIEDAFEISGIEVLHPGGYELSKENR